MRWNTVNKSQWTKLLIFEIKKIHIKNITNSSLWSDQSAKKFNFPLYFFLRFFYLPLPELQTVFWAWHNASCEQTSDTSDMPWNKRSDEFWDLKNLPDHSNPLTYNWNTSSWLPPARRRRSSRGPWSLSVHWRPRWCILRPSGPRRS